MEPLCTQSSVRRRTTRGCTELIFGSLLRPTGIGETGDLLQWPARTRGWTSAPGVLLPPSSPSLEGQKALLCRLWAGAHSTALPLTEGSNSCLPA